MSLVLGQLFPLKPVYTDPKKVNVQKTHGTAGYVNLINKKINYDSLTFNKTQFGNKIVR
jgi:hypothetical protein